MLPFLRFTYNIVVQKIRQNIKTFVNIKTQNLVSSVEQLYEMF